MNKRHLAVLVVVGLLAAACGSSSGDATSGPSTSAPTVSLTTEPDTATPTTETTPSSVVGTSTAGAPVSVVLPEYPLFGDLLAEDQDALDAMAARYLDTGGVPEMERFLFGYVPVDVFDRLLTAGADFEPSTYLWLLHLSGYFGGRWLRGEIAEAQPDALVVGFSDPPTAEAFAPVQARAEAALDVWTGTDDEAAVAYAYDSLFDTPAEDPEADPIRGHADNFGYNQGYLLQILEKPPEGVEASPEYEITCTDGLFDCAYITERLTALRDLADVQAAINAELDPDLRDELLPVQQAAIPRGRSVWDGGLSVQGFSQASYDQLLDVSSSYLETVQATALTAVDAHANGDADAARRSALASAGMTVWLAAYFGGLTNGEGEIEIPAFD
ncbi:MAG: hypothetical protein OEW42_01755 [Acidimicrobiia bacterium]|nr:hypothetical protein [Acidimicrobiia bacterium]